MSDQQTPAASTVSDKDAREQELERSREEWLAKQEKRRAAAKQLANQAAASAKQEMAKPKQDRQ